METRSATGLVDGERPARPRVPKYYLVKQELLKRIEALRPGEALAAERILATELGTSRTTVRQAMQELVVEGRLERFRGSGTYVAQPKLAQPLQLTSYTQDMRAKGLEPSSRLLHLGSIAADADLAERLHIAPGVRVLRVERLRMANGEPMAVETTHLAGKRFPRLRQHLERIGSLYTVLAEVYGVQLVTAEQSIETVLAGPHEAAILGTDVGLPLLMLARHSFDAAGEPVEWVRSVYRGDRYKFVTLLHRPGDELVPGQAPASQPLLVTPLAPRRRQGRA